MRIIQQTVILLLLVGFAVAQIFAQQFPLKILNVRGKVEFQSGTKKVWERAAPGISLGEQDKIKISKDGYMSLTYIPNGKVFEVKKEGTLKVSSLIQEAKELSKGSASQLTAYILRELSTEQNNPYRQNMQNTASVDRALEHGTKQRVVIPVGDGKSVQLYKGSFALLIGVSDYTDGWPKLPGVLSDVAVIQKALEEHGFTVITVLNPKHDKMDETFRNFINKYCMEVENRVIFYFAGHGHTMRQSYGEEMGYIIPADAPNPVRNPQGFIGKAMAMQQLEVYAKQIQSKHALFMFDACFSGSIFALSRAVPENITYKTAKPVRQFITSGSADETVPDKSVFRDQLIAALSGEADGNHDGYLTGTELGEFLQDKVVNYSKNSQHPQYGKIRNPNLDKGDFVFSLKSAIQQPDNTGQSPAVAEPATPSRAETPPQQIAIFSQRKGTSLGLRGAMNINTIKDDLLVTAEVATGDMTGVSFAAGLITDIPFSEQWGALFIASLYDMRSGSSAITDTLRVLYGGLFTGTVESTFLYATIDALARFSIENFWIAAGPSLGIKLAVKRRTFADEKLQEEWDEENPASTRFDIKLGLGYNVQLSSSVILSPDAFIGIPLTQPVDLPLLKSSIFTIQAGISLRFIL